MPTTNFTMGSIDMGKKKQMDRLSRDAAAAKAAGMSYGKWKALQPKYEPKPLKPKGRKEVTCQFCGKVFYQSDNRHRKYCSECRHDAHLACVRKYAREHPERVKKYKEKWRENNAVSEVQQFNA